MQAETGARALKAELLRFLVVGGSAVVTDFTVYFALLWIYPSLAPSLAKVISFVAGAVLSFVLNRGFVFRSTEAFHRQILPFVILYLVSLGLNTGVNAAALELDLHKGVAWLLATGTSTVSNFLGMKLVVFKKKLG